jgi:hypothetical protein
VLLVAIEDLVAGLAGYAEVPAGRGGLAVKLVRGLGVALVFALIGGWLTARRDKASVKEGLERVEGEIKAKLQDFSHDIAWLQLRLDDGEKVYLNCHLEIHIGTPRWEPWLKNPYYDYPTGSFDGMPTV